MSYDGSPGHDLLLRVRSSAFNPFLSVDACTTVLTALKARMSNPVQGVYRE
jgi:hypothetical protein